MGKRSSLFVAALLAAACDEQAGEGGSAPLEIVADAPVMPSDATVASYALGVPVRALGTSASSPLLGTDDGVYAIADGAPVALEVWSEAPDAPVATGAVRAIARWGGEALVAADAGLFVSEGDALLPSPASDALAPLGVRMLAVSGATVWIGGEEGLFSLAGGELSAWSVGGVAGAPDALAQAGDVLYAAWGERLFEIGPLADAPRALELPYGLGAVRRIAACGESVCFATDRGLLERDAAGRYRLYTLGGAAVYDLVVDPLAGTFALIDAGLVLLPPGGAPVGAAALDEVGTIAGADDLGTVWIAGASNVIAVALGAPVGFAAEVAPILAARCMSCHEAPGQNGAPPVALDDYETAAMRAARIAERISTGQMPPAGAEALLPAEIALVLRWTAGGLEP